MSQNRISQDQISQNRISGDRIVTLLTHGFPLWALIVSWAAYQRPAMGMAYAEAIVPLLGVIMFCMGLTLTLNDFRAALTRCRLVALGLCGQYIIMPVAGVLAVKSVGLEGALAVGVILVGCCPGGTASNVICYLARGDTALSVTLTACSTVLAVVATPLLATILIGQRVEIPFFAMMGSVFTMIVVPVTLGMIVNGIFSHRLVPVRPVLPVVSMLAILGVIAIIVSVNATTLATLTGAVTAAVILHNLLGLALGYGLAWVCGADVTRRKTLAIETGMQNSGLAASLATVYFSPQAAIAAALFSIWHNLSGSVLAALWSRHEKSE